MATALEVFNGLIFQVPDQLRPVFNQPGNMMKGHADMLVSHVAENGVTFNATTQALNTVADRVRDTEQSIVTINFTMVQVSKKLDSIDASLGASATLEQAPVIKELRDESGVVKTNVTDAQSVIQSVRTDMMTPTSFEALPTCFFNLKADLTALNAAVTDHGTQLQSLLTGVAAGPTSESTPG